MIRRAPPEESVEDGVVGEDGGGEAVAVGEVEEGEGFGDEAEAGEGFDDEVEDGGGGEGGGA